MSKCTKKCLLFLSFLTGAGVIAGGSNITHALTYQDTVDVQFTFNPTVSINVSGDLIIPNLTPGSALDSNIITVKAGSNDSHGYTLYSTVGSSTNNYTDLRTDSSNTTNVFTNLSSSKASLESFDNNTWGYSYCNTTNDCNTNTNWVSGNAGSTAAGYNGLPLYNASNNATGVILANTTSPNETELKFKIGAKAASTQAAGAYTNTVNFIGVAKVITTTYTLSYVDNSGEATNMPASATTGTTITGAFNITDTAPTRANYIFKGWCTATTNDDTCSGNTIKPGGLYVIGNNPTTFNGSVYAMWKDNTPKTYMQDLTLANCQSQASSGNITVYDRRDESDYTVRYINDACWMTQNLRITGTISSTDSNFSTNSTFNVIATDLKGSSNSYTQAQSHVPTATDADTSGNKPMDTYTADQLGAWYNYCATSAGTVCSEAQKDATEDICPSGWHLPSYKTSPGSIYDITSYSSAFSPIYGGYYNDGSLLSATRYGFWWSRTAYRAVYQYYLYYDNGILGTVDYYKYRGGYVRCVRTS